MIIIFHLKKNGKNNILIDENISNNLSKNGLINNILSSKKIMVDSLNKIKSSKIKSNNIFLKKNQ